MITGLRPATFENLQLNAGVFLVNFDVDSFSDAAALEDGILAALENDAKILGATSGGGSFVAKPSVRTIQLDGMRYAVVGSTVNDVWDCRLTTTLKEVTPENFKRALISCDVDTNKEHVTCLKIRTDIDNKDYIPKISWAGDTNKGFVLIELDNALNIEGATFTFTDRGEGSMPVNFLAHIDNFSKMEYAPARIYFFDEAAA